MADSVRQQQSCVTVINPIPRIPTLQALLEGRDQVATGQTVLLRAKVANTGRATANNVQVDMVFDPQLQLSQATEGADQSRIGQNMITWTVPTIEPGQTKVLEGEFNVDSPQPSCPCETYGPKQRRHLANTDFVFQIVDGTPPPQPVPPPPLPPAGPTPEVPGGSAPRPLQGAPENITPTPPAGSQLSNRLQARLFGRDNPVRVNDPIRYSLRIVNDSNERDGQVGIQFQLPDWRPAGTRGANDKSGTAANTKSTRESFRWLTSGSMEPGESVEYELVLTSNQPQTFDLNVQVRSLRMRDGFVNQSKRCA